jgi:hypothetical protein
VPSVIVANVFHVVYHERVIVEKELDGETYHRYPDSPTPVSLAVAIDQVRLNVPVTVAPLVGMPNVGSAGFVVSKNQVNIAVKGTSTPVWSVTYTFFIPSLHEAIAGIVCATHPVATQVNVH